MLVVCFGVVGLFGDSAYSQNSSWNPPRSSFPLGGGEKKIFDEKDGPIGGARVSPLVFNGTGQALNFAPGQSIKGGSSGNAQIMFTPQGITISSLAGPVSFNTKGIVLKDMGQSGGTAAVTTATGTITRIGGSFKYNIDGTKDGWKDVGGEGLWKKGITDIYYDGGKSGGGWLYVGTKTQQVDGTFVLIKKARAENPICNPEIESCGGGGGGGGGTTPYVIGERIKICDFDLTRDCPQNFIPDPTIRNVGTRGHDLFVEGGITKAAVYEYTPEVAGGLRTVTVGAPGVTKDLVVNGNLVVGGKLSFSPKKVFRSDEFKVGPGGSDSVIQTYTIKDATSGRTDFSFCALGSRWIDANPRSICEVFYDANSKEWKMRVEKWQDAGVACRANCF